MIKNFREAHMKRKLLYLIGVLCIPISISAQEDILLNAMEKELERSFKGLKDKGEAPLYFLQYAVTDEDEIQLSASYGAIQTNRRTRNRYLTVDVRVGSHKLDNTHQLRGKYGYGEGFMSWIPSFERIPIEDDEDAIRAILWSRTDKEFKKAQERFIKVKSERETKVAERDTSPDFSYEEPNEYIGEITPIELDTTQWAIRLANLSAIFKEHPWIYSSSVSLTANATTKYLVNSEGTKIREGLTYYKLGIYGETVADDGMELWLYQPFYSRTPEDLPGDDEIIVAIDSLIKNLKALRDAPYAEPYDGPAILKNKAAAVFFHEIFGHRMEGHRQKLEREGQTFTKKIGEKILPPFISIYDDPTLKKYGDKDLMGYYKYDDEGVKARRVTMVENGVLKNFLMSRSPVEGFPKSSGHGRRSYGYGIVARMGNTIVESSKQVPYSELRKMLIEECKRQDKPYGLVFEDISGGFTRTERVGPQTFKVIPLFVKRVYADGRPDEVVRGVDIVGTPLISFANIIAAGDDSDVFNGICGAESGLVPVGAVSPSILTSKIEVEKKVKAQEKPPILPPPLHE